ncbi:MAG: YihY/virulence factor BrkB family protein [Bacteroidetes bacterium]|nr:YihY/virulence factor BrkB family protein [Bacteroidota bacterium]
MLERLKNICKIFKTTYQKWNEKDPFRQSAIIAYYAIFSLPGLLVLIITIAGYFFGKDTVNKNLIEEVSAMMGADTAEQINSILTSVSKSKSSVGASIFGLVILVVGATGVFIELQKSLNIIWEVKAVPKSGIWLFVKARLFSFGLILAISFLLLVSLVITTGLAALSNWIQSDSSEVMMVVFSILNFLLSIVIISILFALMFKILPDVKIKWKDVWLGSLLTGVLFTIGKTALAIYFGKANPASGYGAAGSIVLVLLWVSYSSMILFFGAEFTANYSKVYSGKVIPSENAVKEVASDSVKSS